MSFPESLTVFVIPKLRDYNCVIQNSFRPIAELTALEIEQVLFVSNRSSCRNRHKFT